MDVRLGVPAPPKASRSRNTFSSLSPLSALAAFFTTLPVALQSLRTWVQKNFYMAVTLGYVPRFLHSTGQLHKGDAGHGLFIQITSGIEDDAPIPDNAGKEDSAMNFGILKKAQIMGDRQALINSSRHVISFDISKDILGGLQKLLEALA